MNTPTGRWSFGRRGGFCYDAELEALLRLRDDDPERWYALRPHQKIRCAFYEAHRAMYEEVTGDERPAPAVDAVTHQP